MSDELQNQSDQNSSSKTSTKTGNGIGCLFAILVVSILIYALVDSSDFYMMPGEGDAWPDAMEVVLEKVPSVIPDSLQLINTLNPLSYYKDQSNIKFVLYKLTPRIKLQSRSDINRTYIMGVTSIVQHVDANEFEVKSFRVDTLYQTN